MKLKNRSYILDEESIQLLKQYAVNHKTSESSALRMIITTFCKGVS